MSFTAGRAVVASRHELYAQALRLALESEVGVEVVGTAVSGSDAMHEAERWRPELMVMTIDLRDGSAINACRTLRENGNTSRLLLLAGAADPDELVNALEAGADGYVAEEVGLHGLGAAARRVLDGETVIPDLMLGDVLRRLIATRRQDDAALTRFNRLSRREQEVLRLIVEGYDHQRIASELVVSPHTARTHVQNVLEKLEVHSRLEAARFALDHRLVERFVLVGSEEAS
jgi:DNA-binding NarL/FixJ family response regulator